MKHWEEIAADIKKTVQDNVSTHPQLNPLLTFLVNFDRKYRSSGFQDKRCSSHFEGTVEEDAEVACLLDQAGLALMSKETLVALKSTIHRQAEEIEALECRIKRLLER